MITYKKEVLVASAKERAMVVFVGSMSRCSSCIQKHRSSQQQRPSQAVVGAS